MAKAVTNIEVSPENKIISFKELAETIEKLSNGKIKYPKPRNGGTETFVGSRPAMVKAAKGVTEKEFNSRVVMQNSWPSYENIRTTDVITLPDGSQVPIEFARSYVNKSVNGNLQRVPVYEEIMMEDGKITVQIPNDENLYWYLMLRNDNESNPNRDTRIEAKFRRVDADRTVREVAEAARDVDKAKRMIDELGMSEIKVLASTYKVDMASEDLVIRHNLKQAAIGNDASRAKTLIGLITNGELRVYADVVHGQDKNIITYDPAYRKWFWMHTGSRDVIIDVMPGNTDYMGAIVTHMKSSDKDYNQLKQLLKA